MNSPRIHPAWLMILAYGASTAFSEVGEFSVSEELIREMQIVRHETEPFKKDGRLVRPDIQIKITPKLKDSDENVALDLNFELSGTSKSRSFTPVMRGKGVTTDITAKVNAQFQQGLTFDGERLLPTEFSGQSHITPQNIKVGNNFNFLKNIVNRKAEKEAGAQVRAGIPQEQKDLEEKMDGEIKTGLKQASKHLDNLYEQIHQVFTETEKFPFESKFSSRSGPDGGIQLRFFGDEGSKGLGPKPELALKNQIASSGVFHQDLLTKTLKEELAGKEMKIAELQAHLCSPTIASLINFCETQPIGGLGLSVIFDEKDPINFKFENGKVTIQINAKNRVGVGTRDLLNSGFLTPAKNAKQGEVDMEPYQVNISYALKNGVALLEDISVRGITEPLNEKESVTKPKENHGVPGTWSGAWKRLSDSGTSFLAGATKNAIEKEFRKIMKEKIEFPIVSFPTKLKAPQNPKDKPEILEASSLVPMEVKAENGWLAVSTALCKENVKPFGVSFDKNNRISAVQPGSPAERSGFKIGDRIESYGNSTDRSIALGSNLDPFLSFITDQSVSKSTTQRIVELKGKTSTGVPFERKVSLCPHQLDHRAGAEALLSLGSDSK